MAARGGVAAMTVRGGAISRALGGVVRNGGFIRIDRAGRIFQGGEYLATFERNGSIVLEAAGSRQLFGRVSNGFLWETRAGGGETVAATVRANLGRRFVLRTGPGSRFPSTSVLRRETLAEVIQMSSGWYQVRLLPTRVTGWVWAPFALLVLAVADDESGEAAPIVGEQVSLTLDTGEAIEGRLDFADETQVALDSSDGSRIICDRSRVARLSSTVNRVPWATNAVSIDLVDGRRIIAASQTLSENGVLQLETGLDEPVFVDPTLIR